MKPFRAPRKCVDNPTLDGQPSKEQVSVRKQQVDSEEATEFELVRSGWIVPETEEQTLLTSQDKTNPAVPESNHVPQLQSHNCVAASPNVSEFEKYLDGLPSQGASTLSSTLPLTKPAHLSKDEWWDTVLQAEKQRLQQLEEARIVPVDDMFPDAGSSDDDIPIVKTLPAATAQARKKKKSKLFGPMKQ